VENPKPVRLAAPLTAAPRAGSVNGDGRHEGAEAMIEARQLTKRYGDKLAVDGLSFTVHPGVVTGFLGPNGAGKSTTMRMILGLDAPTSGSVLVNGKPYREHTAPLREVGALLEAGAVHPGRSAYNHLLALARTSGIRRSRVDEVIEAVGLAGASRRRAGKFSLGMGQRLGIATALLGDPRTVILDEPLNGLDTEGIRWVRAMLQGFAAEGRTVFVSSHLMNEMALTAQHLIVIGKGRLIADTDMAEFIGTRSRRVARVRTTNPDALAARLSGPDVEISSDQDGTLTVSGSTTDHIGRTAAAAGITLLELTAQQASLEEAFVDLTRDAVEYRANPVGASS
jgi:ABC-2 type transport system ATP-binding protein